MEWKSKKTEREALKPCQRIKNAMEHEETEIPFVIGALGKGTGNCRTGRYHSNYSMGKFGQNIEKNPRDLQRLAVTQSPVNDYPLQLV